MRRLLHVNSPRDDSFDGMMDRLQDMPGVEELFAFIGRSGHLHLEMLVIAPSMRNRGIGQAVMERLIQFSEIHDIPITLKAEAPDKADDTPEKNRRRLAFYTRLGFVPNKGRKRDFRFPPGLIRWP